MYLSRNFELSRLKKKNSVELDTLNRAFQRVLQRKIYGEEKEKKIYGEEERKDKREELTKMRNKLRLYQTRWNTVLQDLDF